MTSYSPPIIIMSKVCLVPSPRCVKVMVKIATFPIPPVFCSPVGGCPIGFLLGVTKQETLCCHAALIAYDMSVQRFRYSDGRERKSRDKRGDECPRIWSAWGTLVQIVPRFSKNTVLNSLQHAISGEKFITARAMLALQALY